MLKLTLMQIEVFSLYNQSMLKKLSLPFIAFLQVTGLVIYIIFISSFFTFISPSMDKQVSEFYAPIIMLTLFVISAVISALLILGRAAILFWDKKYAECFKIIYWTVLWGFTYLIIFFLLLYFSK